MSNNKIEGDSKRLLVECPYCHSEQNHKDISTAFILYADFVLWECPCCKKSFKISEEMVYTTKTDCTLNGQKHELGVEFMTPSYDFCVCEKCDYTHAVKRLLPKELIELAE